MNNNQPDPWAGAGAQVDWQGDIITDMILAAGLYVVSVPPHTSLQCYSIGYGL